MFRLLQQDKQCPDICDVRETHLKSSKIKNIESKEMKIDLPWKF